MSKYRRHMGLGFTHCIFVIRLRWR